MNTRPVRVAMPLLLAGGMAAPAADFVSNRSQVTRTGPSAGAINDWLREQWPEMKDWDLGGTFRLRYETKEFMAIPAADPIPGAVDFGAATAEPQNQYYLWRTKVHLGYRASNWLTFYTEGRDSRVTDDKRYPSPDKDAFDLHQAYIRLDRPADLPIYLTAGRQELSLGEERLVGSLDWSNVGRVFDAAKLRWQGETFRLDGFAGRVVIPRDGEFNVANDYEAFWGVYATLPVLVQNHETEIYFLGRNASADSPAALGDNVRPFEEGASPRDIYTLGFRFKSMPGRHGKWDYEIEAAGQMGRFKFDADAESLEHRAFAVHAGGGCTFGDYRTAPRIGLEYNFASGDTDPLDDEHETFENLFPTNHKFYGAMDLFSWQNVHNGRLSITMQPTPGVSVVLDGNAYWLASTSDYFYQADGKPRTVGGYGISPAAGSYVGTEVNFVTTYAYKSVSMQAGYGHFFIGDYPHDALAGSGGAKDANWVYLQGVLSF